jgi:hypothetical protein
VVADIPRWLGSSGRTALLHRQTARSVCATAAQTLRVYVMALNRGKIIEWF